MIYNVYENSMPRKAKKYGKGFFSSIGNALKKVHDFAKDNKIASNLLPGKAGEIAGALGYGRKRRKRRTMMGGGNKMQPHLPQSVVVLR